MTSYLRFPDEAAAMAAFEAAGFTIVSPETEETIIIRDTHEYSLDPIGTIYNNDAVIDPETGEIISPATPIEGWHANYLGELPEGWETLLVSPQMPYRKFAGVD